MAHTDKYAFTDEIAEATRFCATLGPFDIRTIAEGLIAADVPTGTATFVRHEGNVFCMTAKHVLETVDPSGMNGVFLPKAPGVAILGPFMEWKTQYGEHKKDLAIVPIDRDLPAHIGREAFDLDKCSEISAVVPAALAAGFPTTEKSTVREPAGDRVQMKGVIAVAESVGSPATNTQMQFRTETPENPNVDLSGMSGGPVFWSDEPSEEYGLIGLVKEAMDNRPTIIDGVMLYTIHYIVERTPLDQLRENLDRITSEWPRVREELTQNSS